MMHPKAQVLLNFIIIFGSVLLASKATALLIVGEDVRALKGFAFALIFLWFVKVDAS